MKLKNSKRREVIKNFKKQLDIYPYEFPFNEKNITRTKFCKTQVCFARICGIEAFKTVCQYHNMFTNNETFRVGESCVCNDCKYNMVINFAPQVVESGIKEIGLCGKPEIKIDCDERLISSIRKGFYGNYKK